MTDDARATDAEVLETLDEAGKLYEEYLRLSEVTQTLPDEPATSAGPLYDWDHPLGVVINR